MFLHDLTEQIPKNVYVTFEQPPKPRSSSSLVQENIDKAFNRPPRKTIKTAEYGNYKITLLNRKYTNNRGLTTVTDENNVELQVTNLDRTLIDIAVRPFYSGGVLEVLKAYQRAKDKLSVNTINAYLKKINYLYPYHQAIGFYLERAGVSEKYLRHLYKDINFDFYLTYQIKEPLYSKKWRLYYPKYLDDF